MASRQPRINQLNRGDILKDYLRSLPLGKEFTVDEAAVATRMRRDKTYTALQRFYRQRMIERISPKITGTTDNTGDIRYKNV